MDVAKLQSQLQEAQTALVAQQAASPDPALRERITALEQQSLQAQGWIQELLDKGQSLQDKYVYLQKQKALQEAEQLGGLLKVANMEIDRLKKRVQMESDLSEK